MKSTSKFSAYSVLSRFTAVVAVFGLFTTAVSARELAEPRIDFITCEGVDGEVLFELAFQTVDTAAGPQALSMRVSDPYVAESRSEVALFESADGLLSNNGGFVVGYVDLSNPKTGRKGERIGGTTLGQLRSIMVSLEGEAVATTVASMSHGKRYAAQAIYLKTIGQELVQDLDCIRQK